MSNNVLFTKDKNERYLVSNDDYRIVDRMIFGDKEMITLTSENPFSVTVGSADSPETYKSRDLTKSIFDE